MVSIIVPIYNKQDSIQKCIESIIKQSFTDWELILVDDGSTDDSLRICSEYAKRYLNIYVYHKPNGGVSSARNFGIDQAKGEYILFCDSDDYVESDWCEKLFNEICKDKDVVPLCNYYRIREDEKWINKEALCKELTSIIQVSDFFSLNIAELLGVPWNKMYKSEIIRRNKIRFNEDLSLGEDLLFVLDYISCGIKKFVFVNVPLYCYAIGGLSNLSNKYYANLGEIYKTIYTTIRTKLELFEGAFDKHKIAYLKSYFYAINRVFFNSYMKENKNKLIDKWNNNRRIFHSSEFKECKMIMTRDDMNFMQYWGLKSNSFLIYWCFVTISEKISKFLHRK